MTGIQPRSTGCKAKTPLTVLLLRPQDLILSLICLVISHSSVFAALRSHTWWCSKDPGPLLWLFVGRSSNPGPCTCKAYVLPLELPPSPSGLINLFTIISYLGVFFSFICFVLGSLPGDAQDVLLILRCTVSLAPVTNLFSYLETSKSKVLSGLDLLVFFFFFYCSSLFSGPCYHLFSLFNLS